MSYSFFKNRIILNSLLKFVYSPHGSVRNITKLSHSKLSFGKHVFHRIYATGADKRIHGTGVRKSLKEAQLVAIMEFLERRFYYENINQGTTSGLACHFTEPEAKQSALLELIERDQALLSIFYKDSLNRIVDAEVDPAIELYHLQFDLPVFVIMARIGYEENGQAFGFGSSLNLDSAIDKAISEAVIIFSVRNDPVSEPFPSNLFHMLPFLNNNPVLSSLPLFRLNDYEIMDIPKKSISHSMGTSTLTARLTEMNVQVEYRIEKQKIDPFHTIYFCHASSPDLQSLFFSPSEIPINERRIKRVRPYLPKTPPHAVLHPIS